MRIIGRFLYVFSLCSFVLILLLFAGSADALMFSELRLPVNDIKALYTHDQLTLQLRDSTASAFYSAGSFINSSNLNVARGVTEYHVDGDVMTLLFAVFKESIEQTASDKGYFLERLAEMSKIGDALGDYLQELSESLDELTGQSNDPCQQNTANIVKQLMETGTITQLSNLFSSQQSVSLIEVNSVLETKGLLFRLTDDTNQAYNASVPEPATMLLFGAGLAGLGIMRKRFKV